LGPIPGSQIFPFYFFARELKRRFGAEIREVPRERFIDDPWRVPGGVNTVCFQTGFAITEAEFVSFIGVLRDLYPDAYLVYFDWFAPTDLRFASICNENVDVYVKKHVLRDRSKYGKPTQGDTNLTDHYSRRFGIEMPEVCFHVPGSFFDKLLVGSSFVTAPYLLPRFLDGRPPEGERPIDVHARIALEGEKWYRQMRKEAIASVRRLEGLYVVDQGVVSLRQYLWELEHAKICFSPFGYGEVCWRDYEAVVSGALLVKPDTSHIETHPDIFIEGETYVAVEWGLSDFCEKVHYYLDAAEERRKIVHRAFDLLQDYFRSGGFVEEMRPIIDIESHVRLQGMRASRSGER
jgi:hypothetical protein